MTECGVECPHLNVKCDRPADHPGKHSSWIGATKHKWAEMKAAEIRLDYED